MKKSIKLILVVTAILMIVGCSNEDESIKVVLDWTPNTNHTGLYVADQNKYFEDEGLDVEIIQPGEIGADAMVSSGNADFGISFQEYVTFGIDSGLDLLSIGAIMQNNTAGFAARIDKVGENNFNSPIDFANKTYCGFGADVEEAIVKQMFNEDKESRIANGEEIIVTEDDINIQIDSSYLGIMNSNNNECDFYWVYEGWQMIEADSSNIDVDYLAMRDYSDAFNYYTPLIVTSNSFATENEETVTKFMNAVKKGYEYAAEKSDKAAEIMNEFVPEYDLNFIKESQSFVSGEYIKGVDYWGIQEESTWAKFTNFAYDKRLIKEKIDNSKVYTNRFLND